MKRPHESSSLLDRCALSLYAAVRGRDPLVLIGTLVVMVVAFIGASKLTISQDFRRMLPQSSSSIQQLLTIDERIGNQSDLYVVIKSDSRDDNIQFGTELESELRRFKELRSVTFRRELGYLEDRALLYLSLSELLEIHDDVKEAIQDEVRRELALDDEGETEAGSDATPEQDALSDASLESRLAGYERPKEYSETDEGRVMVLTARPTFSNTDAEASQELCTKVESIAQRLLDKGYPGLRIELQGSFAEQSKRQKELDDSVVRGSVLALCILLASIGMYFKSLRVVFWILIPLIISIAAALAFAQWSFGYLNLVSAFIVAILLGIGIDFGIHITSRYAAERRDGHDVDTALKIALETTGISTFAGAVSTALCLLLLLLAEFQGLAQFGVVAAVGVALAFVGAIWILPLLLRYFGEGSGLTKAKRSPIVDDGRRQAPWPFAVSVVLTVVGTLGMAVSIFMLPDLGFEYDLRNLDGKKPAAKANAGEKPVNWRDALPSGATTAIMVATTSTGNQTESIHRQLEGFLKTPFQPKQSREEVGEAEEFEDEDDPFSGRRRDRLSDVRDLAQLVDSRTEHPEVRELYGAPRVDVMKDRIRRVFSLYTFVPEYQMEKLKIIKAIRKELRRKRDQVSVATQEKIDEFQRYLKVNKPIVADELPRWVREQLSDAKGNVDRFVLIWAGGAKADLVNARNIRDAFSVLKTDEGVVNVGATYFIMPAVLDALHRDGPLLLVLAFSVMIATCLFLFRDVRPAFTVVSVVGAAILWLVGLMISQGWKVDLFNLVSIPLIIGMGQDHSIHMVHRIREEGFGALRRIVRETGGAIFLTTWTTAIGFVGALFAPHEGLRSLARVSLSGIILCYLASVFFLPALTEVVARITRREHELNS